MSTRSSFVFLIIQVSLSISLFFTIGCNKKKSSGKTDAGDSGIVDIWDASVDTHSNRGADTNTTTDFISDSGIDSSSTSGTDAADAGNEYVPNPGDTGAACTGAEECFAPLDCIDNKCQPRGCQEGLLGCACGEGSTCVTDSSGTPLQCVTGVCIYSECTAPGETGCPCINGDTCSTTGDTCDNGLCFSGECASGQEGCACLAGTCNAGLFCKDSKICVDATGYEGGSCLSNGQCYEGNRCDQNLNVCVYCELGSEGCHCTGADACSSGLSCTAGICLSANILPPDAPRCYTPCLSDLIAEDAGTVPCDADGLISGCIESFTCTDGSCLAEGAVKPTCETDMDCPFYQTCLQGGCYSNCETNGECPAGLGCHKKVCRAPCRSVTGADTCPDGYACEAPDGENGFCVAMQPPSLSPQIQPNGGFSIDKPVIAFSNIAVTDQFQILSDSAMRQGFTIRKLKHTITYADGATERVEAQKDFTTGEYLECDAAAGECPLYWLDMNAEGEPSRAATLEVEALPNCNETDCPVIVLGNAGGSPGVRWEGELEITSRNGRGVLQLTYVERPEGQWVGSMYYFGNFSDEGIDDWVAREDKNDVTGVSNALIQRWGNFRQGNLSGYGSQSGWEEFKAILTASRTESWKYGEVDKRCRAANPEDPDVACYPFTNTSGIRVYADNTEVSPIPTGLAEFEMAMNLRLPTGGGAALEGRIDSRIAMQFAGNPAVTMSLSQDPASADACASNILSDCVVFVDDLQSEIIVGGRYLADGGTCNPGYNSVQTPWLIPGFTASSVVDETTGLRYQYNCMDNELPFDTASDSSLVNANISLAGGNPVPDGLYRPRTFRLLDGALVNQTSLFILFEEQFESFVGNTGETIGDKGISAYGFMILKKQPVDLDSEDVNQDGIADAFQGSIPPSAIQKNRVEPVGVSCDQNLLANIGLGDPADPALTQQDLSDLIKVLVSGNYVDDGAGTEIPIDQVHYYCEDTGFFDGGASDTGQPTDVLIDCPAGSKVEFFVLTDPLFKDQTGIANEPCQLDGSCRETLNLWRDNGHVEQGSPFWRCTDANAVMCDDNRSDLREEKTFYALSSDNPSEKVFLNLRVAIADAFRYKTRFKSRSGSQVGFSPEICIPDSDQIPYCYDPDSIEEILNRVNCLVAIYSNDDLYNLLETNDLDTKGILDGFLRESFGPAANTTSRDGFERLYGELMVMLGDESLTAAFASRFDLAGAGGASFEGDLFEENGINLSGVAGFEMYRLYQAIQYYQMAIDRLYLFGPNMTKALERNPATDSPNFISAETVVLYLDRLIRASTQKARASSEVAKNYQSFNRPDLARRVIERAYTSTYLESVILARLMRDIMIKSTSADKPQIEKTIEDSQRRYKMALLDMKEVYTSITDNINYFGFAPDYIPFPALSTFNLYDTNAFKALIDTAQSKIEFAKQREAQALASNRSYNTDAASFQSELVRIQNNYEAQLGELCGVFEGPDAQIYPAIRKYADLDRYTSLLGDPCGLIGNGRVFSTIVDLENSFVQQRILQTRLNNIFEEIQIETNRVNKQCKLTMTIADFQFEQAGRTMSLQESISETKTNMGAIIRGIEATSALTQSITFIPGGFSPFNPDGNLSTEGSKALDGAIAFAAAIETSALTVLQETKVRGMEKDIANIERTTARWVAAQQCTAAQIDSNAKTATLMLQTREIELEALKAARQSQVLMSEVGRLFKESKRLQDEQIETEQLLINVEAARNDPNIRIYRNDAVINADIAFNDAMRSAYRATKVFEYYTSQSYARTDQLFLIRMISAGDYNLENYLVQLQNEYYEFEEQFGNPDVRVAVMSLRDDIMKIPTLDGDANPLSQGARIDMMREKLGSVEMLDNNGYLSIPFGTNLDGLSPLTRNHKVVYIEADIVGADVGDTVGRLYLRQAGTGVIRNVEDELDYYVFPERTAVLDPFFNGNRLFEREVYRNFRFRDRPMVNTSWEIMINQRDEEVNKDIDLQSLSDIRLYMYYTDFTVF